MKYSKTIAGITIEICEKAIGEDLVLTLSGGEKPHIGCVVQAVPRPSLSGDGTISVTSSVIKSKIFFITFSSNVFFSLLLLLSISSLVLPFLSQIIIVQYFSIWLKLRCK